MPAAAAVAVGLDENAGNSRLAGNIAREWAAEDPHAVGEWLLELPPGTGRDRSTVGLVLNLAKADPGGAFGWALQIDDPALRERYVRLSISVLADNEPAAAMTALESAELTPAARSALLAESA